MEALNQDWCKQTNSPELNLYKREQNNLTLQKGILYRRASPRESDKSLLQLVLPPAYREVALKGCHNEVGHLGLECMLDLMRDRFFWPHMAVQAKEHVGKCRPCLAFKARQPKVPLKNIVATHPLELVHLDFLCLESGKGREENVLVITDHFTRYAPGVCNQDPNSSDHGKDPVGQVHCPLWSSRKNTHWSGTQFWESVGGWPLCVDGSAKDMDQPVLSTDQWSMWKIQFHPDQYAWDPTQGKEVRVEGSHWNIGPCIQLHSKLSHRVQPLLPHVR